MALADTTTDTVVAWIEVAKNKLLTLRENIKSKIQTDIVVEKEAPAKKPAPKKAPVEKTVAKKPAAKKPQA
jgi:hypothetical protein